MDSLVRLASSSSTFATSSSDLSSSIRFLRPTTLRSAYLKSKRFTVRFSVNFITWKKKTTGFVSDRDQNRNFLVQFCSFQSSRTQQSSRECRNRKTSSVRTVTSLRLLGGEIVNQVQEVLLWVTSRHDSVLDCLCKACWDCPSDSSSTSFIYRRSCKGQNGTSQMTALGF